jgi:hypothetical protein
MRTPETIPYGDEPTRYGFACRPIVAAGLSLYEVSLLRSWGEVDIKLVAHLEHSPQFGIGDIDREVRARRPLGSPSGAQLNCSCTKPTCNFALIFGMLFSMMERASGLIASKPLGSS